VLRGIVIVSSRKRGIKEIHLPAHERQSTGRRQEAGEAPKIIWENTV